MLQFQCTYRFDFSKHDRPQISNKTDIQKTLDFLKPCFCRHACFRNYVFSSTTRLRELLQHSCLENCQTIASTSMEPLHCCHRILKRLRNWEWGNMSFTRRVLFCQFFFLGNFFPNAFCIPITAD